MNDEDESKSKSLMIVTQEQKLAVQDETSIETSEKEARTPTEAELNLKKILRDSSNSHVGAIAQAVGIYPA